MGVGSGGGGEGAQGARRNSPFVWKFRCLKKIAQKRTLYVGIRNLKKLLY
jgi:hypothetical protein